MLQTWLEPHKERFVSMWTDEQLNFGQRTTNRVESQHALLKKHLDSTNSTLDRVVPYIDQVLKGQEIAIRESFEKSKIHVYNHHDIPVFDLLRRQISLEALDLLLGELKMIDTLLEANAACACHLFKSCGLPCACRLIAYRDTGNKHSARLNLMSLYNLFASFLVQCR